MGILTGYKVSDGQGGTGTVDIGMNMVEKSYLIDRYPELNNTFKQSGLWLWGLNSSGELGTGNLTDRTSPVQTMSGSNNWKQVSCGMNHTAAIKTDGTLWLWGGGGYGKLGNNNAAANQSSPVQTVSAGATWKQVDCHDGSTTAAIKTDGSLWLWGDGSNGQLGNNATTNRSSPVQTVSAGTTWKQVTCGMGHTAAIKTNGQLWLWGGNGDGQLGDNTRTNKSSPVQTISQGTNWKQVSCGRFHTAAIKTDGTLWTWGRNDFGQLGNNAGGIGVIASSPVQTISGGTTWYKVSVGQNVTAAIKTDGTLWLWGQNSYGALGDNTITSKSSPVQTIAGGTNWKQVSSGTGTAGLSFYTSVAAIKTDGTLWTWGWYSGLGSGNTLLRSSPIQTISGGTNWKYVGAAGSHTGAIRDTSEDLI